MIGGRNLLSKKGVVGAGWSAGRAFIGQIYHSGVICPCLFLMWVEFSTGSDLCSIGSFWAASIPFCKKGWSLDCCRSGKSGVSPPLGHPSQVGVQVSYGCGL